MVEEIKERKNGTSNKQLYDYFIYLLIKDMSVAHQTKSKK